MKNLAFAIAEPPRSALAGCSSNNQDPVNNAEVNQPAADDLNEMANDAAKDAANAKPRARQPAAAAERPECGGDDNAVNPTDAQEQNVSGM